MNLEAGRSIGDAATNSATATGELYRPSSDVSEEGLRSFRETMPDTYRGWYEEEAIRTHAAIVENRGGRSAHAAIWATEGNGEVGICVVADDRPGLLSLVAGALAVRRLDIVAARAYVRMPRGAAKEAVQLFSIRRLPMDEPLGVIDGAEIARFAEVLDRLVAGSLDVEWVIKRASPEADRKSIAPSGTWVRFETEEDGSLVLLVDTNDRPALLLTITRCLFGLCLRITASDLQSLRGRVHNRFYVAELDGGAPDASRQRAIEAALSVAIENLGSIANAIM
jgi:[protein-PII] uridylyltransferase